MLFGGEHRGRRRLLQGPRVRPTLSTREPHTMKLRYLILPFAIATALAACKDETPASTTADTTAAAPAPATPPAATPKRFAYPEAKVVEQSDDYHGTKVADPYRWMEDLEGEALRQIGRAHV